MTQEEFESIVLLDEEIKGAEILLENTEKLIRACKKRQNKTWYKRTRFKLELRIRKHLTMVMLLSHKQSIEYKLSLLKRQFESIKVTFTEDGCKL